MLIHVHIEWIQSVVRFHPFIHRLDDLIHLYNLIYCLGQIREHSNFMAYDQSISNRNIAGFFIQEIELPTFTIMYN